MDQGEGARRQGEELNAPDCRPSSGAGGAAESRAVRLGSRTVRVADDQPTFWDRVDAGRWEPGTLALLGRLLGPDTLFVDVGAWVGPLTLLAAGAGATVAALEADPRAASQFRRNLLANPELAGRVTLIERALAPRAGPVRFAARRKPGDSMSSALLAAGGGETWDTEGITPSDLAGALPPAARRVLKLDIEGGEYALLPALGPLLGAPTVAVLVAFHPAILRESGTEPDTLPSAALLQALSGWSAARIGHVGADPAKPGSHAGTLDGEWLFTRPEADGGPARRP